MAGPDKERVPQTMQPIFDAIVAQTDEICAENLNQEYAALARRMAAALARKRPSPLSKGKPATWACGILYTLGRANFLFDQSQTPHMRADALCELCGVSKSTGAAKAKAIEEALHTDWLDPTWSLPSRLANHPTAWFIQVNGLIVDARHMPLEIQEEAYHKGLIPYIPALGPPTGDIQGK
jgi:hypothetical protein